MYQVDRTPTLLPSLTSCTLIQTLTWLRYLHNEGQPDTKMLYGTPPWGIPQSGKHSIFCINFIYSSMVS